MQSNEQKSELIYNTIFPTECKYNGMIHLAVLTKTKEMKSLGYCDSSKIKTRIDNLKILQSHNYYISANKTYPYTTRRAEYLFTLNNIVLDFDIHQRMNQYERTRLVEEFVWRAKRDLFSIQAPYNIPQPAILHYTSRGCQMWWPIQETSAKLLFLYHQVIDLLVLSFKAMLEEYPELKKHIEIDISASKNSVGLFRLFDTYNTHTKQKTETEILHLNRYDLNCLKAFLLSNESIINHFEKEKEKQIQKNIQRTAAKKGMQTKQKGNGYTSLHKKRVAFIERLAEERENNIGERNKMIYLAYTSAIQYLSPDDAKKLCKKINRSFNEPLPNIKHIFNEIDKLKNPYKFSNKKFLEWLNITEYEQREFYADYSKKSMNLTRDAERKKRAEQQVQRKKLAKELRAAGLTYKAIAEQTKLSVSTIYRLVGQTKPNPKNKPWESLGISRATYYRNMKNNNE